jgi:hypothetical protein
MIWNLKKLKSSSFVFLFNERCDRNIDLNAFIRWSACFKYYKMLSLCERYWVNNTKSMSVLIKFTICDHLFMNNDVNIDINCRTIVFCSIFVHCLTRLKWLNIFNFVKNVTHLKRASSRFNSLDRFRFFDIEISVFNNDLIQFNKCMIMFFNNWWKTFIIMISWMFIKSWFQTKFLISWIQRSLILFMFSIYCWRNWIRVDSWIRRNHVFSRFSFSFEEIRQMIQCCSLLTFVMIICSSNRKQISIKAKNIVDIENRRISSKSRLTWHIFELLQWH